LINNYGYPVSYGNLTRKSDPWLSSYLLEFFPNEKIQRRVLRVFVIALILANFAEIAQAGEKTKFVTKTVEKTFSSSLIQESTVLIDSSLQSFSSKITIKT